MDFKNLTGPCGIDCFNCWAYLAKDDHELRKKVSEQRGVPLEKAFCTGCRNVNGICPILGMKEPCLVYKCIQKKGLSFCYECDEFPCDYLHPYADRANDVPHNTKVFNLALMRRMGVDQWAGEKAKNVRETYFKGKWRI
jgi:hypothetical protein